MRITVNPGQFWLYNGPTWPSFVFKVTHKTSRGFRIGHAVLFKKLDSGGSYYFLAQNMAVHMTKGNLNFKDHFIPLGTNLDNIKLLYDFYTREEVEAYYKDQQKRYRPMDTINGKINDFVDALSDLFRGNK